tara:strand:+ start:358 stop:558 length:201 start_codon:yes stop_codon:yes gene_type:complete
MIKFEKGQEVWVKLPAQNGVDGFCWIRGEVVKTTAKRVKVHYNNGFDHQTYQAPHNVCPIEQNPLD